MISGQHFTGFVESPKAPSIVNGYPASSADMGDTAIMLGLQIAMPVITLFDKGG